MPKETLQDFESDPKNKIISADEIKKIEEINNYLNPKKTENSETNEWSEQLDNAKIKINQIDDAFLTDIKRQWELILKWIKYEEWKEPTAQQITAMLSLLKIHQMKNPWSIEWNISLSWNNGAELSIDDVLDVVWTVPDEFWGIIPQEVINYLNDLLASRKDKLDNDRKNFNDAAVKWDIYENPVQWNVEWGSQDTVDSNPEVSAEKAKIYIQNLINDMSDLKRDAINNRDIVNKNFNIIRKEAQQNKEKFWIAVNALLDHIFEDWKTNPDTIQKRGLDNIPERDLNDKTMYSEKVRLFQKIAYDMEDYKDIIGAWMAADKAADGKLWYNTLDALLKINRFNDRFQVKTDRKEVNKWVERTQDWKEAEKYPDNVKRILSMWEFWADGKFKFYNWEKGKEDYVQEDDKWKFVNIWWERYYIEWECKCWDEFNKFKQVVKPYIWFDENWNEITLYKRILSFWKVHENWRFEWTKVTIDWNQKQVKSETFDAPKERTIWDKKVPSSIVDVKLWNKIDDKWDFKWKWRIDLFTDKDKKTLNEKELNSLDKSDILAFLNKAIRNYKETNHKPSEIWQSNLNLVIDLAIRELHKENNWDVLWDLVKNADPSTWYFAKGLSPEERVSKFLNLDYGLSSNPDHKINKNNLEGDAAKKYEEAETNADKRNIRKWEKQWVRIINRLEWLVAVLEKSKILDKWEKENQDVVNPDE